MLKSSLFSKLHEGAGSNRGSKYQDRVNAEIDNPKKEPKTVKPKQAAQVDDLDQAYIDQKATYGNLYTIDRTSLQTLQDELGSLPFRLSETASKTLLIALKNIMFNAEYPNVQKLVASNPGFTELGNILEYSGPISINAAEDVVKQLQSAPAYALDSKNTENGGQAYAAIVALVLPFVDPNIVMKAIYDYPNVKETFKAYGQAYSGTLLNQIDWEAELPDFSKFEHIAEPLAKQFLGLVKAVVTGAQQSKLPPRLVKLAKRGAQEADAAFAKSLSGSIASNKHKNNVVKNIYYSMVTRALPANADFFELNDQEGQSEVKKFFDNPDAQNKAQILTDKAQTLIAARIVSVERNPFLYKGTLGQNSKTQLAFDYAKRVAFKKNKKAETNDKTVDVIAKLFDGALKLVPGMEAHMEKLGTLLDSYFRPEPTPEVTTPEVVKEANEQTVSKAAELKAALDNFSDEGLVLLQQSLSNDTLTKIFASLAKNQAFASLQLDPKTAVEHYLQPFKEALIGRFAIIKSITQTDLEEIFTIGNAVTDFLADALTKKKITAYIDSFNSYVKTRAAEGDEEGFKFIYKAAEIPALLQEAKKKLKKTKNTVEKETKTKDKVQLAVSQYKAIHDARKKILDTKHLLQQLPDKAASLLVHIKNSINSLSPNALNALVSGSAEEAEKAEIDSFFNKLVSSLYDAYFNDSAFGLLANDAEPNVIKEYIASDLKEKAAKGLLVASGSLRSYVDYYDGLNEDFINFINLSAAIKDTHKGISVDEAGNISFSYALESTSLRDAFFNKFFFGDLTSRVSAEPVVTLAAHRTMLRRLQQPAKEVLDNVTIEEILTPELVKTQPELANRLNKYFINLKNTANAGIELAVGQIDRDILDLAAGSYIPLINVAPESGTEYSAYYIPGIIDKEYEATITTLGSNALRLLSKVPGAETASKEFFRNICISGAMGGETIVGLMQNALDIISTAINIDVARQTFYGSDSQIQIVNGLIRKYQKAGNVDAINDIKKAKDIADNYLNSLTKATERKKKLPDGTVVPVQGTGIEGTHVLSGSDNHVDNPLLLAVLRQFNDTIKSDSWAVMAAKYKEQVDTEKAAGTYHTSDLNLVVSKLGIAYTRIGIFEDTEEPEAVVTEAVEPDATMSGGADDMATKLAQPVFVQGEKGAKFNPSALKSMVKDLEKRIYGSEQVQLNKGQRHGQNYKQVTSYKELFTKSKASMHTISELVGSFLTSTGQKALALELVKEVKITERNFDTLASPATKSGDGKGELSASTGTGFFDIIADPNTLATANVPIQTKLMNALKTLQPIEHSPIFEEVFLKTPNPKSEAYNTRLYATFSRTAGASALFQLLKSGKDLELVKQEVAGVLGSLATMDPEAKARFNAFADMRDLDPAEEAPVQQAAAAPVAPKPALGVPEKAAAFLNMVSNKPIPQYAVHQYKDEYIKRYATLFDPSTYASVDPELGRKLKSEAPRVAHAGGAQFNAAIEKEIATGKVVNQITGTPVTSLIDLSSLYESKRALALALFEADEAEKNLPVNVLAAVLSRKGVVANGGQLVTQAGKPYLFSEFSSLYWMLFGTNSTVTEAASTVNRLFKTKDQLEFQVAGHKYEYARVVDFNRLKELVDTYFKPEELNSEPTNEPAEAPEVK